MPTKTVHIVRHGKAVQDCFSIRDDDRPLIEKGIVNNITNAKKLHSLYPAPELIISSHAARALHTAHIFARVTGYPLHRVQVNENLYADGEIEMDYILKSLPDEIDSVMIVGHNPDVTLVAYHLAGSYIDPLATSGVVSICFETDRWSEIGNAKAKHTCIT